MGQSGRASRMFGIVQDVTERKLVEMALRERVQLLDLTHDTIFVRNMSDVISFWNHGAEQLYGWNREEAVGQVAHELLRTIFPAPLEEITSELLRTGRWEGELTHTKRDGSRVAVASRWSLRQDERGRPIGILETNNDITERKRAEYLTGHVFESSPDGMAIVGRDYRFQRVNPVHERFWAQPAGSMVGKLTAEIMGREFFEQKGKSNLDRCFAGEEVRYADWFDTPRGRKYRAMTVSPLRPRLAAGGGRTLDRPRFHGSRAGVGSVARGADGARSRQSGYDHGATDGLDRPRSQPAGRRGGHQRECRFALACGRNRLISRRYGQALESIIKAAIRPAKSSSGFATSSKSSPRGRRLGYQRNDPDDRLTRSEVQRHGVSFKTQFANGLPRMRGDRVQLQQVILNLIINAIEAMSETGEGARGLLIGSSKMTCRRRVARTRFGPGLEIGGPRSASSIRFIRPSRRHGHGSLDLPLDHRSARRTLWATANTPGGATFQFTLHHSDGS